MCYTKYIPKHSKINYINNKLKGVYKMQVLEKFKSLRLLFVNDEKEVKPKFKVPDGTDDVWDINNIIIPDYIRNSRPNKKKVAEYINRCKALHHLDKPITVIKDTSYPDSPWVILTDGFIRFLISERAGYKQVPIRWER